MALIRDHVFTALRRLCPAKLEGKGKGDLISMLTSDVELLEVFYAHTISPVLIALIMSVSMSVLIGMWHPLLGVIALCSYAVVGIALPLRISSRCDDLGIRCRTQAGEFSSFMLESLRGLDETIQYGAGEARKLSCMSAARSCQRKKGSCACAAARAWH
ncbi:MAG: ABC transporter transmembrane domain-containing protein [Merdibacter sp.]